jgi:hypothetical protein
MAAQLYPETKPLYPQITVQLVGTDGNAFALVAKVVLALRAAGVGKVTVSCFIEEAMEGEYDQLLRVCMRWVDVQ